MLGASGKQQGLAIHVCVSVLTQTLFPSRLPCNTEQSCLCCAVDPCLQLTQLLCNTRLNYKVFAVFYSCETMMWTLWVHRLHTRNLDEYLACESFPKYFFNELTAGFGYIHCFLVMLIQIIFLAEKYWQFMYLEFWGKSIQDEEMALLKMSTFLWGSIFLVHL